MSKFCFICHKGPHAGSQIKRRGLAKKKGGVGKRITGVTKRRFLPNLQRVRAVLEGKSRTIWVCAQCLRSGKVAKS